MQAVRGCQKEMRYDGGGVEEDKGGEEERLGGGRDRGQKEEVKEREKTEEMDREWRWRVEERLGEVERVVAEGFREVMGQLGEVMRELGEVKELIESEEVGSELERLEDGEEGGREE